MIQSQYLPNSYTGNGAQTTYPFNFRILQKVDLVVTVSGLLKTLNVDYTIADIYVDNDTGGQMVFTTAPPNTAPIILSRATALTQLNQFPEGGPFPAAVVEESLDKLTMIDQEQATLIGVTPPAPPGGVGGLSLTGRSAIAQNANSFVITHSLNNANKFLVMSFLNWNSGAPYIIAQDANTITVAWPNGCPYSSGGSIQWGVL